MTVRIVAAILAGALVAGCGAGASKLTKKSEEKLAAGDAWRAWELATRALDKEPGNPKARDAATAAGISIVQDWQRQVRALAEVDSLKAADEVLELTEFREHAARYATVPVGADWPNEERTIRQTAARVHYQRGREAASAGRPKRAWTDLTDADRFVSGYRDAARRAERAFDEAQTHVAVVPFRTGSADGSLGVQVAQAWRGDLAQNLTPPQVRFTRVLPGDDLERSMRVSDLAGLSRDEAIRLGREVGADRVVWGSIGRVKSTTRLDLFRDTVARKVVTKHEGVQTVNWEEVPIEVVARVRDVAVGIDYEVIATGSGASLAHRHFDRSISARVVWTAYQPEGDPASYSLVSETTRASDPKRAQEIEKRWKSVCGDGTTLVQVLEARRSAGRTGRYAREALPRFAAGAAFVFLEDLPPAEDLAYSALTQGFSPLRGDLVRLDSLDDGELSAAIRDSERR